MFLETQEIVYLGDGSLSREQSCAGREGDKSFSVVAYAFVWHMYIAFLLAAVISFLWSLTSDVNVLIVADVTSSALDWSLSSYSSSIETLLFRQFNLLQSLLAQSYWWFHTFFPRQYCSFWSLSSYSIMEETLLFRRFTLAQSLLAQSYWWLHTFFPRQYCSFLVWWTKLVSTRNVTSVCKKRNISM
jgi:hypothetical protein